MTSRLVISGEEKTYLSHLPPALKRKVRMALDDIRSHPAVGKQLIEKLEALRSYRVGRFRVIYRATPGQIAIIAVGPRETVYRKAVMEIVSKHKS